MHCLPGSHVDHVQALIALLREDHEANAKDENGDSALHAIVKHKRNKRLDLLLTLLTHSNANVNLPAAEGNTALHFAAMVRITTWHSILSIHNPIPQYPYYP